MKAFFDDRNGTYAVNISTAILKNMNFSMINSSVQQTPHFNFNYFKIMIQFNGKILSGKTLILSLQYYCNFLFFNFIIM